LVAAVFDPTEITDVQSKLLATRAFAAVDAFDASAKTPTLSDLKPYTAVLLFNNVKFASPSALGDVLADYWDGGGAVVLTMSAVSDLNADSSSPLSEYWISSLQGRFGTATNGYLLLNNAATDTAATGAPDSLGKVAEPHSPLMVGVATISSFSAVASGGRVINGGAVVARWANDGLPLVVRGKRAGRPLAAVNMYPANSLELEDYVGGSVGELLRNALLYSACKPGHQVTCAPCRKCDYHAVSSGCPVGSVADKTCTCKAGYHGDGLSCTRCSRLKCGPHAVDSGCPSSFGSTAPNRCICKAGYYGDGTTCAPCLKCDPHAVDSEPGCPAGTATINTCTCNSYYYSGDGITCTPW